MTAVPPIGVLALQGDVVDHMRALEAAGARAVPVRRASELDAVAGLVIPGGESTTMSKLLEIFDLFEPVKKRLDAGLPVFGSCAGMIMLADEVLDGRPDQRSFGAIPMTVRRNAFGRQVDSFETEIAIDGIAGDPFRAVFIRAPWVERVGEGVRVLARVAGAPDGAAASASGSGAGSGGEQGGRIVAVRAGACLATSFHPEVTSDARVHEYFVDMVRGADAGPVE
ncbi:pyridoxal 5'-phosphate synthase glutaminase subunit PdxT [Glycomyces algeriensis]|uniref:Pyridoxal 5'-phosphate synthase subunit PdxT n=1 Tax=Glycomyces algeriensis TaxID=256037 RepID=A0A9W6G9D7_9ACTN|nr:pyridoxal 5'-phosphate synthase glutaminase subunit PdxT [Glycomyces algeriensis]MDA1364862.1 pyridoxal 5'-phosphate synthase glutaminase subunit PdxT [Glycomyces algeriensis]MDR7350079.1 5'-phosphate synthase pdxT subunit [Glycomyces algeriensis]GLI42791.1 pyridoxal 5'-phosphate synthase subunit PdxT [Glycomyces algeriensis]